MPDPVATNLKTDRSHDQQPTQPPLGYQPPRLIRLGGWQAVTLVNSLPGGPGASVFSSSKPGFWKDLGL